MVLSPEIRDQAYQFFIQEAPELLQVIEAELLTLKQERSTAKVHNLMRAAHSIKGGAASVGLDTIKTIAHRLEDVFKALYSEELQIDVEMERLLLQAYDCLRLPLIQQITIGQLASGPALMQADSVFVQLEVLLKGFLGGAANLPSSIELGVDITLSIFEVDVAQGLECLAAAIAQGQNLAVAEELRSQAEVFVGLAELLNLPGFSNIAQAATTALDVHPEQSLAIAQLALNDFQAARQAVIAGDRTQGGAPSIELISLTSSAIVSPLVVSTDEIYSADITSGLEHAEAGLLLSPSLDEVFGDLTWASEGSATRADTDLGLELAEVEVSLTPSLDEVFDSLALAPFGQEEPTIFPSPSLDDISCQSFSSFSQTAEIDSASLTLSQGSIDQELEPEPFTIEAMVHSIEQSFDQLSPLSETIAPLVAAPIVKISQRSAVPVQASVINTKQDHLQKGSEANPNLSVRVDLERLERMNNQVGELAINRNSLSLQNEQLQGAVQKLLQRFDRFQILGKQLHHQSDQLLIAPERYSYDRASASWPLGGVKSEYTSKALELLSFRQSGFDSLEMDSYGELHSLMQTILEEMVQLEETVGDIALFARQSSQSLEQQRQMLTHLRSDLMWARMLPLGEVLNRFPRILHDLSTTYHKPAHLKLSGTRVLVDKAVLEKLYDPLLHLLRNAFDHGIEPVETRRRQGKPEQGQIEIRAHHQGSQTIVEIRDDGQGLNLERIRQRVLELGLLSVQQLETTPITQLWDLLFEAGFSTASQVSELSGRGMGLEVVRSQLHSLKGTVTVSSEVGQGTTFTLRLPLTLTIARLLVCSVGAAAFAFLSDNIEEILIPKPELIKRSGTQRFLYWREQIISIHSLSHFLEYACPFPETATSQALMAVPAPKEWHSPVLVLRQGKQIIALEIERLITEQELVIKPFGNVLAAPSYLYGCTILGDGSLIPVVDGTALLTELTDQGSAVSLSTQTAISSVRNGLVLSKSTTSTKALTTPTLLVVDDSIGLRQTLALTLQKAGYRVLQARDGREALDQLRQETAIRLVICDVEMPNMNGFEFLSHRRQDQLLTSIPVVMLTSRNSDKHRKLAMHLGATDYFTKPYLEQDFLVALKTIIEQSVPTTLPSLATSTRNL
ncbi:hybrid sensor histidine kinase/response regulator [Leptolyngbya sp. FACHB-261]|uniref:hybrid sensor histidine kinase/response regulator n=1 Tax=Leptolyngbya sp. FACHB-261 TaxID=2692806 RepID=UPI001683CDD1|nr:hybrid sensor histidine kinase/response regulator [Leptolyngbya sp. FACHB-261]MBD2100630.1 hybrid sensor histidine kinase/response regulator [Leptolyngbya sp. FACHB-261]